MDIPGKQTDLAYKIDQAQDRLDQDEIKEIIKQVRDINREAPFVRR